MSSHVWCSLASVIMVAILIMLMICMIFMQNQYYDFLFQTTHSTEEALLETVSANIQSLMEDYVQIGSSICVDTDLMTDTDLYASIWEFAESPKGAADNQRIKNALKITGNLSSRIVGVAVADEDGILYQYDKYEISATTKIDLWNDQESVRDIFEKMHELSSNNQIPRYLIVPYPNEHPNVSGKRILNIAFPFRTGYSYRNIPYILLLSFNISPLEGILSQLTERQEGYVEGFLEDSEGRILLHTGGSEHIGEKAEVYQNQKMLEDLSKEISDYGWRLHAVIDEKQIKTKVEESYRPVLLLFFAVLLFILIMLLWSSNRTLRPIYMIGDSISRVRRGETKEKIPILGKNEIWQLAESYNRMLDAIDLANEQVAVQHARMIENMKMKQRAEREALESQINAHFICNTLNAINYEAIDSGDYKVSLLLKKLSNILRYTFDQKHQNVYMRQEIVWIEQYLYLQKERMEAVFDYEIVFDSDYDNWPCRKLMLQPFVENSISHGFEGMQEGGLIRITGEGYREFLKIVIQDNGCGMDREQCEMIRDILKNPRAAAEKRMGIGISNVITRMRMYYGELFEVRLETEKGKGTSFTFILPTPGQMPGKEGMDNENSDRRG